MREVEPVSWDARIRDVVFPVRAAIQETTQSSLVGLYIYGSLVAGDFDPEVSDIDMIAVLSVDAVDELAAALEAMHDALARRHPVWDGRIDVVYVTASHLRHCQSTAAPLAVISPGEPFHVVSGGLEWILTWYPARQEAVSLVGPPMSSIVPEISEAVFLDQVRVRMKAFRTAIGDSDTPDAVEHLRAPRLHGERGERGGTAAPLRSEGDEPKSGRLP
jgi:hypothetical protein